MSVINSGIKGVIKSKVTKEKTQVGMGSGAYEVLAIPAMIAMMEKACEESVQPYLKNSEGTVGISVDVRNTSSTPLGMEIRCESELVRVERRRLVFHIASYDERGLVGYGTHVRFMVNHQEFLNWSADSHLI